MIRKAQPWTSTRILAVDVEGNGRQPHELIELAIVPIVNGTVSEEHRSWLVRPIHSVTNRVIAIHGITNELLAGCPRFQNVAQEVQEALGEFTVVGHRVHVDYELIKRSLPSWQPTAMIDTWKLARRAFPDLASYSLANLVDHFDLALNGLGPSHRALPDALAAARLFLKLMLVVDPGGELSVDQVVDWGGNNVNARQMRLF